MNRIFKTVFNQVRGQYVVVHEVVHRLAQSVRSGKSDGSGKALTAVAVGALLLSGQTALAQDPINSGTEAKFNAETLTSTPSSPYWLAQLSGTALEAQSNTLTLSDGDYTDKTIGIASLTLGALPNAFDVQNNTLELRGGTFSGTLLYAYQVTGKEEGTSQTVSGNTLVVQTTGVNVNAVDGFQNYHFVVPDGVTNETVFLSKNGDALNVDGTSIRVTLAENMPRECRLVLIDNIVSSDDPSLTLEGVNRDKYEVDFGVGPGSDSNAALNLNLMWRYSLPELLAGKESATGNPISESRNSYTLKENTTVAGPLGTLVPFAGHGDSRTFTIEGKLSDELPELKATKGITVNAGGELRLRNLKFSVDSGSEVINNGTLRIEGFNLLSIEVEKPEDLTRFAHGIEGKKGTTIFETSVDMGEAYLKQHLVKVETVNDLSGSIGYTLIVNAQNLQTDKASDFGGVSLGNRATLVLKGGTQDFVTNSNDIYRTNSGDASTVRIADRVANAAEIKAQSIILDSGAQLKLTDTGTISADVLSLSDGTLLDLQNGEIDRVNAANIFAGTTQGAQLKIDVDLTAETNDKFHVIGVDSSGTFLLGAGSINLLSGLPTGVDTASFSLFTSLSCSQPALNVGTSVDAQYLQVVYRDEDTYYFQQDKNEVGTILVRRGGGYSLQEVMAGKILPFDTVYAMSPEEFRLTAPVDLTQSLTLARIRSDQKRELTINGDVSGQNATMNGNGNSGFVVDGQNALTLKNLNLTGFKDSALTVNKGSFATLDHVAIAGTMGDTPVDVVNNGTLHLKENNQLEHGITGEEGTLKIDASCDFSNLSINQKTVEISSGKTLTIRSDQLTTVNDVDQSVYGVEVQSGGAGAGVLKLIGGTASSLVENKNAVSGDGLVEIAGFVKNTVALHSQVKIDSDCKLESDAALVGGFLGNVQNDGTLVLTEDQETSFDFTHNKNDTKIYGSVFSSALSGEGTIEIKKGNAVVFYMNEIGNPMIVREDALLTTMTANSIQNSVTVEKGAELRLILGELEKPVSGAGKTTVYFEVDVSSPIDTSIEIKPTGDLLAVNDSFTVSRALTNDGKMTAKALILKEGATLAGSGSITASTLALEDGSDASGYTGTVTINDGASTFGSSVNVIPSVCVGKKDDQHHATLDVTAVPESVSLEKVTLQGGELIALSGQIFNLEGTPAWRWANGESAVGTLEMADPCYFEADKTDIENLVGQVAGLGLKWDGVPAQNLDALVSKGQGHDGNVDDEAFVTLLTADENLSLGGENPLKNVKIKKLYGPKSTANIGKDASLTVNTVDLKVLNLSTGAVGCVKESGHIEAVNFKAIRDGEKAAKLTLTNTAVETMKFEKNSGDALVEVFGTTETETTIIAQAGATGTIQIGSSGEGKKNGVFNVKEGSTLEKLRFFLDPTGTEFVNASGLNLPAENLTAGVIAGHNSWVSFGDKSIDSVVGSFINARRQNWAGEAMAHVGKSTSVAGYIYVDASMRSLAGFVAPADGSVVVQNGVLSVAPGAMLSGTTLTVSKDGTLYLPELANAEDLSLSRWLDFSGDKTIDSEAKIVVDASHRATYDASQEKFTVQKDLDGLYAPNTTGHYPDKESANKAAEFSYASGAQALALTTINLVADGVQAHARLDSESNRPGALWAHLDGSYVRAAAYGFGNAGFNARVGGFTLGTQASPAKNWIAGVTFSASSGRVTGRKSADGIVNDTSYVGAGFYAGYKTQSAKLTGGLTWLHGKNDISKGKENVSPSSQSFAVDFRGDLDVPLGTEFSFTPHIGVRYLFHSMREFETNDAIAYASRDMHLLEWPMGFALTGKRKTKAGTRLEGAFDLTITPTMGSTKGETRLTRGSLSDTVRARVASNLLYQTTFGFTAENGPHRLEARYGLELGVFSRVDHELHLSYRYAF